MNCSLAKLKVLVVDDNLHMTSIVKTILRAFEVKDLFEATDADDAIALLRTQPIDLIIMDYAMEPIDGCQLTRLIRQSDDSKHQFGPIIMLTAYAERSKVEAPRDAGVTEFWAKPVTAMQIYRKVSTVINAPQAWPLGISDGSANRVGSASASVAPHWLPVAVANGGTLAI